MTYHEIRQIVFGSKEEKMFGDGDMLGDCYVDIKGHGDVSLIFIYQDIKYSLKMTSTKEDFDELRKKFLHETENTQYETVCSKCCQKVDKEPPPQTFLERMFFSEEAVRDAKANEFAGRMGIDFIRCLQFLVKTHGTELLLFAKRLLVHMTDKEYCEASYSLRMQNKVCDLIYQTRFTVRSMKLQKRENWKTK